jgi:UDP-N-acetylglucosamine 2-epimerase (non-hydrolysing)/GDP/UDP-N,N'-diacetylbacillosamine 2-epimerase (hydrolysing)
MNQVDVVVGNSSSGVLEAPSLNIPAVDIGDRQKGRERASSVFNTPAERNAIVEAISKAESRGRQPTVSPYGDGESSQRFADTVAAVPDFRQLLKKTFYDMAPGETVP